MINITSFFLMLVNGLAIAVIAIVYIDILAFEPVLNWWFKWGAKFQFKKCSMKENPVWKLIWGCAKCFSGQFAFWLYLCAHFSRKAGLFPFFGYNVLSHLFFVSIAVFWAWLLKQILSKQGFL